jgi:hypothetical protein
MMDGLRALAEPLGRVVAPPVALAAQPILERVAV